nr:unnamed protein product [Callosobruchus chinensis]
MLLLPLILMIFVILLYGYQSTRKPRHFPPGPRWWPFLGCAPQVQLLRNRTGHLLLATSKLARKYGPVIGLKVGGELVVVVHGAEAVREFLANDDLSGRPNSSLYTFRSWGKRLGIVMTDGDFWTEQRRFLVRHLRDFGFGTTNMSTLLEEESQELVKYLQRRTNGGEGVVNMHSLFSTPILNTLWRMLAGVRYDTGDPKLAELHEILADMLKQVSMVGKTFAAFPILRYLAPEASGMVDISTEVDEHKQTYDPECPRDVMDLYLTMINGNAKLQNSTFSEQQLIITCMDMFMAGSETTSNTLSFCFLYLVLYPEVQKKAQEEIDKVLGREKVPTLSDKHKLQYVECVIWESLRMFVGRGFTLPHRSIRDTELCGYFIPKDVKIVGNFYDSLLGDQCAMEDPMVFRPERYLKDGEVVVPENILPFGVGKRRCIGEALARGNLFLFVTVLLQRFNFSVLPNAGPPSTDWEDGLTPRPKPFQVVVSMWLPILLFVLAIILIAYKTTRKPKGFPPGPRWWPFIGSAPQIEALRKRTGHFLLATAEMARKYGPVLGLKVGGETIVVVHGFQANREFLSSDGLAGRPKGPFFDLRSWGKRLGILLVDEEFWIEQRRFLLRHLREFGFGTRNMSTLVEEETQELVNHVNSIIDHDDRSIFNMHNLFCVPILNSLWKMLAGNRYGAGDEKMVELQQILADLFKQISMVGTTFSYFPILKYLAPEASGYNLYVKSHMRIWEFLFKELEYHKKTHNPDMPRDVMDIYLDVIKSAETQSVHESFSEEQLVALAMDMFMAGSETTSNTLSFCFLYLLLYPEVQKKAQDEIDAVVGKTRVPSLDDRPKLPYVECVVLESLRMFSGRALTVPHRSLKDTYLNGYLIPKDVTVVGNLYGCMLEEDCGFEEPNIFRPERFIRDGKISVPENLIPFGFGKHRCLGETLARANVFLFIAAMLQNFTFCAVPEYPPTLDWMDGVTPRTKPFKAIIKKR